MVLSHRKLELVRNPGHRVLGDTAAPCPASTVRGDDSEAHSPTESRSPRIWRMVRMDALSEELCNENTSVFYSRRGRWEAAWSGVHVEMAGLCASSLPPRKTSCKKKMPKGVLPKQ